MVHGLARREEPKLSDYKRWKLEKSQVIVPAEPQNNNAGNNADNNSKWLKNQTPYEARISTQYKAGDFSKIYTRNS